MFFNLSVVAAERRGSVRCSKTNLPRGAIPRTYEACCVARRPADEARGVLRIREPRENGSGTLLSFDRLRQSCTSGSARARARALPAGKESETRIRTPHTTIGTASGNARENHGAK